MLLSLKDELVSETDEISFSDEESDLNAKKMMNIENSIIPNVKTSSGKSIIEKIYNIIFTDN